jgi:glycosyltransferase involved in cell wall biosynthesis
VTAEHAVAVAAIDGLASAECGVASVVRWFFEGIDAIAGLVPALDEAPWDLHAISPRISDSSASYSTSVQQRVEEVCGKHGGRFLWLDNDNDADLADVWSHDDPTRWDAMSASLAREVAGLCTRYAKVTLLVHGVMLADVRSYVPDLANLQVVYVTHSLGRAFTDGTADHRTAMENKAFPAMARHPLDRIGYIGPFFHDVLRTRYGLRAADLVPFLNGIPATATRPADTRPPDGGNPGIPEGRRLMFSWGRCHPQKGFDVLIPAFTRFRRQDRNRDWHLVALMPQGLTDPAYRATIDTLLADAVPGSVTAVTSFDPQLPLSVLARPDLEVVVFASRFEGAPLSVLEALAYGHADLRLLWHDTPSVAQFLDGQTGGTPFPRLDVDVLAEALGAVAEGTVGIGGTRPPSFEESTARGLRESLRWW